jgi:endonuclease/exonuclease/phosphatase family metal-dependent hydrolase
VITARELRSTNTLSGDPTVAGSAGGGVLHLVTEGGTPSNEVFALPQRTGSNGKPFWKAVAGGFRYADPRGENGPVASLVLRKAKNGTFTLRAVLSGKRAPLAALPPNPGTQAYALLALSGGDRYCVAFGPPATIDDDGARGFRAFRVTTEGCPATVSGELLALAYNVAGLPQGISGSNPATNTQIISPLLNAYDLVLVQESWQTPDPNPLAPTRTYHEVLVADATHPYKSIAAPAPLGSNPLRPSALLADGLNRMARVPFAAVTRIMWSGCHASSADCLATKGFSIARTTFAPGVEVDVYNLHMEAGGDPEDHALRDAGVTQLVAEMNGYSAGRAIIIGGDFNLNTNNQPQQTQYARLLAEAGLQDVCAAVSCPSPGRIDKFAFRSGGGVTLAPLSWRFETDVFVDPQGGPLSDHDALAVRFAWSATAP